MDSWRFLPEVLPRFFQGSPKRVSHSARQVPGNSQAAPGRTSRQLSDSFSQRPALPNESPRAVSQAFLGSQKIVQGIPGFPDNSRGTLGSSQAIPGSSQTNHISRMAITNHISSTTILLLGTFGVVPIWCFCRVVSPCPFFQNDLFKRSPQVFQLMFLSCCFIFFVHCTKAL